MQQPRQGEFTADAFGPWAMAQPSGRFELDDGRGVAMRPGRAGHSIARPDAAMALRASIAARGLSCQAFPDGMAVRIDARAVIHHRRDEGGEVAVRYLFEGA